MTASPAGDLPGALWTPELTFGDRARRIRRELKISQKSFAEQIGANPQSYSAWESDQARPRDIVAVAKRIEMAFRVPATWVLGMDSGPSADRPTGSPTREYDSSVSGTVLAFPLASDERRPNRDGAADNRSSGPVAIHAASPLVGDYGKGWNCAHSA